LSREFKGLEFYAHAEIGLTYLITPSIAVNANIMLLRYERNSSRPGRTFTNGSWGSEVDRNLDVSNRGIYNLSGRQILHVGLIIPLGLWGNNY